MIGSFLLRRSPVTVYYFICKKKFYKKEKKNVGLSYLRPIGYISSHPITISVIPGKKERKSRGIAMKRVKKENVSQIRDDNTSAYLPQDLIIEILLKLPTKSIPKLIVVSKLWSSIIRSKSFIDQYLEQSQSRPRSLFSFERNSILFFHSISQSQEEAAAAPSSCTTTSRFYVRFDLRLLSECHYITPPVRGLICVKDLDKVVITNPSTGQFLVLPKVRTRRRRISRFFGYDPIGDEYKVLCMTVLQKREPVVSEEHQVFTLGGGGAAWRMIKCKVPHCPVTRGLWMTNGVIYYGAWSNSDIHKRGSLVVCFDVRSEEFTLVKLPDGVEIFSGGSELVNYQGKVALLNFSHNGNFGMRVLDDVVKQEWSEILVVVPSWTDLVGGYFFYCRGVISSGEFIFSAYFYSDGRFFIVSYDPKKDVARRVEIEGFNHGLQYVIVLLDYAECPTFF
ncbi:PREDICTED: F-box/kelch-repeat protein At3g04660-like [Camelina sativa]|uniref:F-box/kelch-repeat protein At3g04660-like n=1 Tax=Camelina sativa TaxID=90675 RepID=A0ABM1QD18_CAMSA|nr:PREDICTED: F-box/kelch-repeat protein At3g04660-like [Camelina sativa]